MEREFNLIDEPWICVRTADCQIKEVSLKEVILHAHEYIELSGETKSQDFAILRLLLAIMYTVFSRYDIHGDEISISELKENSDLVMDNWEEIWNSGQIPSEPIECYFHEWHERFWLFHEKYPFYQSNAVKDKGTFYNTGKMIGTLFESGNKKRLFSARMGQGRILSYAESARWLLHTNCFDDIASKNKKRKVPKRTWVGQLSLIALRGKNLFETMMLNYHADVDIKEGVLTSTPSWESDGKNLIDVSNLENNCVKISVPDNQSALLSLRSRQVYLCRENNFVKGYYISGGDYFEDVEVFSEQMTLWKSYEDKKILKFKPKLYDISRKAWQEFSSIAVLADKNEKSEADKKFRKAGVIEWLCELLHNQNILDENYMAKIDTAAVIYDYGQATSLPVIDTISDSLVFHSKLLLEVGHVWRERIIQEIEKCDKVAMAVYSLYKDLQKASGRKDKDAKESQSGEIDAKMQFYDKIDYPFRLWLAGLDPMTMKLDDCVTELETKLLKIAFDFGDELTAQSGSNTIFGRYSKPEKEKKITEITSSAQALNLFRSKIKKIFESAGEKNEQE